MLASQRTSTAVAQQQRRGHGMAVVPRPRVALRAVGTRQSTSTTAQATASTSSVDFQDAPVARPAAGAPQKPAAPPRSGHKGAGGPFAPAVVAVRGVMGEKEFNKFRGKAISLHSQVIKSFGDGFGVNTKQVQALIRLAKKNGEWLGFLA